MKTSCIARACLIAAGMLLAVRPLAAATVSSEALEKLDPRLGPIATAAVEHRVVPLMATALTRQLFRQNSPFDARWNAAGQVQVYLHYDRYGAPPSEPELAALGATGIVTSPELAVVQAWIPADKLVTAARFSEVTRISLPQYAVVRRAPTITALPRTGSVDTQGDQILGAQSFRAATGWTGQGITVGVISDGDDHIATSQKTGDLPAAIWNDPRDAGGTGGFSPASSGDEGTAMMEIVYDLSPGVKQLGFCGPQTTVDFVTCLNDFANQFGNANLIIVDDLGFPGVAMFKDGGFATAVENFAISHPDIQLVTAAGNDARGFWSGTWNATPVNITVNGVAYTQAEDFGNGNTQLSFSVQPGDTAFWILEWDDPWPDSVNGQPPSGTTDPNDYDIVLFSSNGTPLACNQGENINTSNGTCNQANAQPLNTPGPQPVQGSNWQNTGSSAQTVHLQIFKVAGSPGPNLKLLVGSQKSNIITVNPNLPAGGIFGQSALAFPYEITVGAVSSSNTSTIESYSSRGPVSIEFPSAETRLKPDIVGVDCVNTTGAGGFSEPFCGTSAAAPHIAGLLALLKSAYQGSSKTPFELLQDGAIHLLDSTSAYPNDTYGYGLPNLMDTLNADPVPLAISFGVPSSITAGTAVTFTGGCLANGSSSGVNYNWNFGPDANPATSTSSDPGVTYSSGGTFNVSLTCSNAQGLSNSLTQSVSVVNAPPPKSGGSGGLGLLALASLLLLQLAAVRRKATG